MNTQKKLMIACIIASLAIFGCQKNKPKSPVAQPAQTEQSSVESASEPLGEFAELFDPSSSYSKIMQILLKLDPCFFTENYGSECDFFSWDYYHLAFKYVSHLSEADIQEFINKDWGAVEVRLEELRREYYNWQESAVASSLINCIENDIKIYKLLKEHSLSDSNRILKNAVEAYSKRYKSNYEEWELDDVPVYSRQDILDLMTDDTDLNFKYFGRPLIFDIRDPELYAEFLKRGADVNTFDKYGETPLHEAILNNDAEIVSLIIKNHPDINATDKNGNTPLHLALERDNEEIISMVLEKKPNLNIVNKNGHTPIFYAPCDPVLLEKLISAGADVNDIGFRHAECLSCIELLMSHGVDINTEDRFGKTLLFYVQNLEMVKRYVELGADLKHKDIYGNTLLHRNDLSADLLEYYLKAGLDVNARNNENVAPISFCSHEFNSTECANLNHECLQIFKKYGADYSDVHVLNFLDKNYLGNIGFCPDSISYLFENGYKVNKIPENFMSVVHNLSAHWPFHNEFEPTDGTTTYTEEMLVIDALLPFLIKQGLDVQERDEDGNTLLFYARSDKTFKSLVEAGIDVNSENNLGDTVLFNNVDEGLGLYPRSLSVKIQAGADVNHRNKNGETPIFKYIFVSNYHNGDLFQGFRTEIPVSLIEELLDAGADVNVKDNSGKPLIFKFAEIDYSGNDVTSCPDEVIELLTQHGADVNITDNDGKTPLMVFNTIKNKKIGYLCDPYEVQYSLIEAGADIYAKDKSGKSVKDYYEEEDFKNLEEFYKKSKAAPRGVSQIAATSEP